MDPKSLSSIDPKLRETYERVMGTVGPSAPTSNPNPTVTTSVTSVPNDMPLPSADTPPVVVNVVNQAPASETPAETPVAPEATPTAQPVSEPTPDLAPSESPFASAQPAQPTTEAGTPPIMIQQTVKYPQPLTPPATAVAQAHSSSPLLKTLYIIGAIVFFMLYTVFWIKIFKIPFFF